MGVDSIDGRRDVADTKKDCQSGTWLQRNKFVKSVTGRAVSGRAVHTAGPLMLRFSAFTRELHSALCVPLVNISLRPNGFLEPSVILKIFALVPWLVQKFGHLTSDSKELFTRHEMHHYERSVKSGAKFFLK